MIYDKILFSGNYSLFSIIQVDNCNTEVSNVLVSVLDCLLSAPCELKDDDGMCSKLYQLKARE